MNSRFYSHSFLAAESYSHFQTSTMLLLSYSTGCYSNTLIDVDTNVPIKSIVLIFETFLFQNSVVFVGEGAPSFLHAGSE